MRLVKPPTGTPLTPEAEAALAEAEFVVQAAFGPGRRYWTMSGLVAIDRGVLRMVLAVDADETSRVVVEAPLESVRVLAKPWWSFGAGLYLEAAGERYTIEPRSFYPLATPGKIASARDATSELEALLRAEGINP